MIYHLKDRYTPKIRSTPTTEMMIVLTNDDLKRENEKVLLLKVVKILIYVRIR